jgi:two-component system cell cycle sensor histidine kinase/response regulator CckA
MEKDLRKTGIDLIGNASWGTHFCQFYRTPEDLIDILVRYFKAGLENNEFCMWITAEPLNAKKTKASLKKVLGNLDDYIEKGQIEILDYSQWFTKSGKFDADEVLDGWVEKEKQALERGFDGLRLTGNTFWLEDRDWRGFADYEEVVNDVIGNYKILAVCSYSLDKCGATEITDVVANHQFALVKRENRWEIIESSKEKRMKDVLKKKTHNLNGRVKELNCLYAISKLIEIPDISFDELIQGVVDLISLVPVYPENTCSRILLEKKEYKTKNFKEAIRKQSSDIFVHGKRMGVLEVYQLEEKPEIYEGPFFKEEKSLINAIAERLGQIIEKKQGEEVARRNRIKYYDRFIDAPIMYVITENRNSLPIIADINNMFLYKTGYSRDEIVGQPLDKLYSPGSRYKSSEGGYQRTLNGGFIEEQREMEAKNGRVINTTLHALPEKDDFGKVTGTRAAFIDITESKHLEKQLIQSQKMEAISTLASSVAHDFNNILTTIIGYAELALETVDKDESLSEDIKEIKMAGERAAALTRQLLAFSHKQIIQPKIVDLNELLTDIEKMIVCLIGEDIEILMIPKSALCKVEIDPGQMEQVIMNLVVNAKDAMPIGGKLTIETVNMDLDENYFRKHGIVEKQPGSYVMLTVSDTGIGMDKEVQEHIFDPFYTTKEKGKGTGLGLSTIYGIVKQNNGFIWVYSETGQGSTFKIYLPKAKGDVKAEEKEQTPVENFDGSETVLIVEDEDSLRKFVQKALQQYGYRVLMAENGENAFRIGKEHEGTIDLMITDVVMPKMGGKKTAERLQPLYPQMKVIYMSGYTDNSIVHHGVLAPGLNFLEKPFSPEGLVRKVRQVLDKQIDD